MMNRTKELKAQNKTFQLMLEYPMLSNGELAEAQGIELSEFKAYVDKLCLMLIPASIYGKLTPIKRRLYILLHYGERFPNMPDSWREALIDPLFDTRRKS